MHPARHLTACPKNPHGFMLLNGPQSRVLLEWANRSRFALLAVNADSPAAVGDCLEAARQLDAPIIIETSLWQLNGSSFGRDDPYLGLLRYITDLAVLAESDRFRSVPVVFHTDHIKGPLTLPLLKAAIEGITTPLGDQKITAVASTLSLDSSELSADENIESICSLCRFSESLGQKATLEMEAGIDQGLTPVETADTLLGAVENRHPGHLALWAPGVGTEHGLGRENRVDVKAIETHQQRATSICQRPVGLALHGSSGLSAESLKAAVAAGTVKVNWSSESLLVRSQAARDYFMTNGDKLQKGHPEFKRFAMDHGLQEFVSRRYLPIVSDRIELLGASGKASSFLAMGISAPSNESNVTQT